MNNDRYGFFENTPAIMFSVVALMLLSFVLGWLMSLFIRPDQLFQWASLRWGADRPAQATGLSDADPYGLKPIPKGKPAVSYDPVLVARAVNLSVPSPETKEPVYFAVLDRDFWNLRLDDAVVRKVPLNQKEEPPVVAPEALYSVLVEAESDLYQAEQVVQRLATGGYTPFVLPASDALGTQWYAVFTDDYPSLEKARAAVPELETTVALKSVIVTAGELSLRPLRELKMMLPEPEVASKPEEPKEPEPTEKPEPVPPESVGPYTIQVACYTQIEKALIGMDLYRKKGLTPFLLGSGENTKYCGWVIYQGHFTDAALARAAAKEFKLTDYMIHNRPYATRIGWYDDEAELAKISDTLTQLGFGSYTAQDADGHTWLFSGLFESEQDAEKRIERLSAEGITAVLQTR